MSTVIEHPLYTGKYHKTLKTTVYLTTSLTAVANDTATPIPWEAAIDSVSAWAIGTPTEIVAPEGVTGVRICLHTEWAINGTGYRSLRIFVDGSQAGTVSPGDDIYSVSDVRLPNGVISDHQTATSLRMACPPGAVFTVSVRQTSTASLNLLSASTFADFEWYFD